MKKQITKVEEFNKIFRAGFQDKPCNILYKNACLRHDLMAEENQEYLTACYNNDLVEIADALGDKLYILLGTIINHGMQDIIEEVFDRIHDSNMTKLEDGKPLINGENGVYDDSRPPGKVLKSKNYVPVNLKDLVV